MRSFMVAIVLLAVALCAANAQLIANFNISGALTGFTLDEYNPDIIYAENYGPHNYSVLAFNYKEEKVVWRHTFVNLTENLAVFFTNGVIVFHNGITLLEKASGAVVWEIPTPTGPDGDLDGILTGKAYDSHGAIIDVLFYVRYNTRSYWTGVWAIDLTNGKQLWEYSQRGEGGYITVVGASKVKKAHTSVVSLQKLPGIILLDYPTLIFVDGHGVVTALSNSSYTGVIVFITDDFKIIEHVNDYFPDSYFEIFDATKNFTKVGTIPSTNVKGSNYANFLVAPDHADLAFISLVRLYPNSSQGVTLMNLTSCKPVWTNSNINKYLNPDQISRGNSYQIVGGDGNLYFQVDGPISNSTLLKMDSKTGDILKTRNYYDYRYNQITAEGIWIGENLIDLGNHTFITNVQAQKF